MVILDNELNIFIKENFIEEFNELKFTPNLFLDIPDRLENLCITYKDNNKIVGLINGIPVKCKVNGIDKIFIYVEPLIIDKEYRNKKIAIELKYEISKISMLKYNILNSIFVTSYPLNNSMINKSSLHINNNTGIRLEKEIYLKYIKNNEANTEKIENDLVNYEKFLEIMKEIPEEETIKFIFTENQYKYLFKNTYYKNNIFFCYEYYDFKTIEIKFYIGEDKMLELSKVLKKNIIYNSDTNDNNVIKKYYLYTYNYSNDLKNYLIYYF